MLSNLFPYVPTLPEIRLSVKKALDFKRFFSFFLFKNSEGRSDLVCRTGNTGIPGGFTSASCLKREALGCRSHEVMWLSGDPERRRCTPFISCFCFVFPF